MSRYMPSSIAFCDNFLDNAEVNLAENKKQLAELRAKVVVPELEAIKTWNVAEVTAWVELEERELDWTRTHDPKAAWKKFLSAYGIKEKYRFDEPD